MKRLFWALAAALMMFAPVALAQTAQEITDTCTLSAVGKKTLGRMTDGQYQTYWASSSGSYAYVEIEAEESVGGLYVQFYEDIAALEVQTTDDAGAWRTVAVSGGSFLNEYIALDAGTETVRIRPKDGKGRLFIAELHVFGEGDTPDWVQQWEAPLDKAENVRRQICLTLEEMNIQPESSHHEQGPGQNEVDFRYAEALEAADNFVTFKWVVKSMASSSGLFASFLPKPLPHAPGSGLHLSVSINKNGKNLFQPSFEESAEGQSFVAGILQRAAEMTIFCNPLTNSFQRLGEFEAPKYITWSHQNSRPLITVPLSEDSTAHRFKLRAFDGCINPYIVFALLIHAGLDGIEQGLPLPPACDENLFTASDEVRARYETLPGALCDAIRIAKDSDFITKYLPEKARTAFFAAKQAEHDRIVLADDRTAAERSLYFERY